MKVFEISNFTFNADDVSNLPYIIKYKKGKDNVVADALSRKNILLTHLHVKVPGFREFV